MSQTAATQSEELTRLEILRAFKVHFAGDVRGQGRRNHTPFEEGRVVQYHTIVDDWDVPEIHHVVRDAIQDHLQAIHAGKRSQIVILAGEPGMGKSHLLNHFRAPSLAKELGYVLVCNSNHWKVSEFEECLLDWIVEAVVRPSPDEPHLLLEKIEDIAFQALGQILARPGQLKKYASHKNAGYLKRVWLKLVGNTHGRFQQALHKRDAGIFRWLDFNAFSGFVCNRFLLDSGNSFHRFVLRVLLRYLFPEDREKVLHWLRRKSVEAAFLHQIGALETIDRNYKVLDTIKILLSLFTPEVARTLSPVPDQGRGLVFFFAFDQMEGRQELFDKEDDWFKFFAQLSELYNALPNVFILFTMTTGLRDKLYPKMERQFQQRIHRDQKFVLHGIDDAAILSLYRRRLGHWLGNAAELEEIRLQVQDPRFQYLPFTQKEILDGARNKTLREATDDLDRRFRNYLLENVTLTDPRFEMLVILSELRTAEEKAHPFYYTDRHLETVTQLLNQAGGFFAAAYGLAYSGMQAWPTTDGLPALRLEFRSLDHDKSWVRVFLARLPFHFNAKLEGCNNLLANLQKDRNYLWLLRPDKVNADWQEMRPGQVFARTLPLSTETSLQAILKLLEKRDQFKVDVWKQAEEVLLEEFKLTYLGELFHQAAEALDAQGNEKEPGEALAEEKA